MKNDFLISLVLTSHNRIDDLDRFISSLIMQEIDFNIELIFVNQGNYNPFCNLRLPTFLQYKMIEVGHLIPLSVARNIGLRHVTGAIIAFPDDDCWYGITVLSSVQRVFARNPELQCICTNVFDPEKGRTYGGRPIGIRLPVTLSNIFSLPISVGMFVRRQAFEVVGAKFNESLGAGTFLGSGEETELVARLLGSGAPILYVGDISVFHPVTDYQLADAAKFYAYGLGYGYLATTLIKRGGYIVLLHWLNVMVRSLFGALFYLFNETKRAVYWRRFVGVFNGSWLALRGNSLPTKS